MSRALDFAWTAILLALSAIRQRPVRSALTAFGMLVGVAAVTIVVALAEGASKVVTGAIDTLGANALMVAPRPASQSGLRDADRPAGLDDGDVEALTIDTPAIVQAAPLVQGMQQIVTDSGNVSTTVIGSTRAFFAVREWYPSRGEIWSQGAESSRERVCLIGETVRAELFGPEDPVGRTIRIGRFPFRVVGLLSKKGQNPFGGDQDDAVVMPLSTLRAKLVKMRPGQVHRILFAASSPETVETARQKATEILRQRHGILDDAPDDFEVRSQEEFRKAQRQIVGTLQMLLLGIAAVSLVVGGIGVMNIMLVSVAERTQEIGVRLAIGARGSDILAQFLVEAVVLTILGGLGGAVAAAGGVAVLRDALELPMKLSMPALGVALAVSTTIGVLFGFFPAAGAARLDPIEALRAD